MGNQFPSVPSHTLLFSTFSLFFSTSNILCLDGSFFVFVFALVLIDFHDFLYQWVDFLHQREKIITILLFSISSALCTPLPLGL